MRETVTTWIDALGLLLVAVGCGSAAAGVLLASRVLVAAGVGGVVAGGVLVAGSALATRLAHDPALRELERRWKRELAAERSEIP